MTIDFAGATDTPRPQDGHLNLLTPSELKKERTRLAKVLETMAIMNRLGWAVDGEDKAQERLAWIRTRLRESRAVVYHHLRGGLWSQTYHRLLTVYQREDGTSYVVRRFRRHGVYMGGEFTRRVPVHFIDGVAHVFIDSSKTEPKFDRWEQE